MGVNIINLAFAYGLHSQSHGTLATLTRWGNHIKPVRGRAIARNLCINLCTPRQGVFQFFQHNNPATASNNETIAVCIKRSGRAFGRIVIFGRHRAHRIKQAGQSPIQLLPPASENDILLVKLDLFHPVADTMGRGRTGRGNRIIHPANFERSRQTSRIRGRHATGHHKRPHFLWRTLFGNGIMGIKQVQGTWPTRPHNQPRAVV